jgi:Zn-dependent protease
MIDQQTIYEIVLLAPPLLLSLTVHEYAHARMALAFGDPTAKLQGRVTLNPLAHLDPIGTVVLLVTRFIGWAKPVPVNSANLSPRRLGDIAVSLAGPLSNLALAVVSGAMIKLMFVAGIPFDSSGLAHTAYMMLMSTMLANLALCVFNLIPLFPLDGHHVLREILPASQRIRFMAWQIRYGSVMLAAIIFLPLLLSKLTDRAIFDPIHWVYGKASSIAFWALGL